MGLIRYTGPNDWSALYVDGELEIVGDHTQVDERIAEICNVEVRIGDDFLMGGNGLHYVAQTLEQLESYQNRQQDRARGVAKSLRDKAAELLNEAQALENEYLK
jgi:hypothetical protein